MSEAVDGDESESPVVVRGARPADADAVAAFTRDTWGERHEDYIPRVFPEWAESDDPDRGTFVATLPPDAAAAGDLDDREAGDTHVTGDGDGAADAGDPEAVVGCIQGALLGEWEAWGQGIRVDPAARGHGVGTALSEAVLDWARGRGATVCRNMVFSWNVMGLGQSRAVGFDPATEFRFAEPEPDPDALTATLPGSNRSPTPTRTRRGRSGATATPATGCAASRSTRASRGPARGSPAKSSRPRPPRTGCSRSPTPTRSPASPFGPA